MSFTKVNNLFIDRQKDISGNAVKVFIFLSRCINEKENDNKVWPSYSSIKENTGIGGNQSIRSAIEELLSLGFIERIEQSGFNTANRYYLGVIENEEEYQSRLVDFQKMKAEKSLKITKRLSRELTTPVKGINHPCQGN